MVVFLNHPAQIINYSYPSPFFISGKTSDAAQKAKFISQTTREHLVLVLQVGQMLFWHWIIEKDMILIFGVG